MKTLEQVFTRLPEASLTVNLAKCEFGKASVTYLGRQVGHGQVLPLEAKVSAISECPIPVCSFSRKFNKHQVWYSTTEKETLALLFALKQFDVYVGSSPLPVVVFTDYNPLVFLSHVLSQPATHAMGTDCARLQFRNSSRKRFRQYVGR